MTGPDPVRHGAARAVWGASPAGTTFAEGEEPGTRAFFDKVLAKRATVEMPWLAEVVPFASFAGRRVIELGCGAGYDAYAICRAGATYTGIDVTPENVTRTRRHLALYGFEPTVREGDAERLEFPDASFDVAYSNGVLHHTPNIARSFAEAHRVLAPGGEFWVLLYHKHSIFHWVSLGLVDHWMKLGFRRQSFRDRLASIEYTTSGRLPIVNVYSRREVSTLLRAAGFEVTSTAVRKLVPEDLPALPLIGRLWRRVPQSLLDAVGRRFGWYVVAHARKV